MASNEDDEVVFIKEVKRSPVAYSSSFSNHGNIFEKLSRKLKFDLEDIINVSDVSTRSSNERISFQDAFGVSIQLGSKR